MLIRYNRKAIYLVFVLSLFIIYALVSKWKNVTKPSVHQKPNDNQHHYEAEKSPGFVVNKQDYQVEIQVDRYGNDPFNKVYNFQITDKRPVPHCLHKSPSLESVISAPEEQFQPVELNSRSAYVYSAYQDEKDKIRVFLALDDRRVRNLYCQLWYRHDQRVMYASPGAMSIIPEGGGAPYDSAFIVCDNPSPEVPYAVSVSKDPCDQPANILRVISKPQTPPLSSNERKFAACITPLNLNYDKMHQLVEYLEFSKLMGVSHFYFYNYSSSQRTADILRKYGDNMVTILQWKLPMKVHVWPVPPNYREEIKYFGQMLMLNECIMRSRAYQYVAFADLDELLVPRKHLNWNQLLQEISPNSDVVGYVFRNTFFKTEFSSDPRVLKNQTITRLGAMSLIKTKREHEIAPSGSRSKLIVRPQFIDIMGVHNIWRAKSGSIVTVSVDLGLCHHYRYWEGMGTQSFIVDDNIWRLKEELVKRLTGAYQQLQIDPNVAGS